MGITNEELGRIANGPPSKFATAALIEEVRDWKSSYLKLAAERDDWRRRAETMLVANQAVNAQLERVSAELAEVKSKWEACAEAGRDLEDQTTRLTAANTELWAENARLREACQAGYDAMARMRGLTASDSAALDKLQAALAENEGDAANG